VRTLAVLLLMYLLFLVQASIGPWWPDLVVVALVVITLHESRTVSTLAGAWAGLCLDMTNPASLGTQFLALAASGYLVSLLHTVMYRARWATVGFVLLALALKRALAFLTGLGLPETTPLLVSSLLSLGLTPLAELVLSRLLYRKWQPA